MTAIASTVAISTHGRCWLMMTPWRYTAGCAPVTPIRWAERADAYRLA